jgi:ribosome-binding protein aMBF1 (putative translation factor)
MGAPNRYYAFPAVMATGCSARLLLRCHVRVLGLKGASMPMHKDLLGQRVGERLRAARRNNNLSQEELGKLIGTSKQQILKYEKAMDIPPLSRLVQLAAALNMPLSFFSEDHYISKIL